MDVVTLNHEQFLAFTGWSHNHCLKQTTASRLNKLESMGTIPLQVTGRGCTASYTFRIPPSFWPMLLVDEMRFNAVGASYIEAILNGQDLVSTQLGSYVRFNCELYEELASAFSANYEAVKATCTRIRSFLHRYGYIYTNKSSTSHRVKEKAEGPWMNGEEAVLYDRRARQSWRSFNQAKLKIYRQRVDATAEFVPDKLIKQDIKHHSRIAIKEQLKIEHYRVVKRTETSPILLEDINWAREAFLSSLNLSMVRAGLLERQDTHRKNKQRQDVINKLYTAHYQSQQPTKEQLSQIQQLMRMAEIKLERPSIPVTEEQQQRLSQAIDKALFS